MYSRPYNHSWLNVHNILVSIWPVDLFTSWISCSQNFMCFSARKGSSILVSLIVSPLVHLMFYFTFTTCLLCIAISNSYSIRFILKVSIHVNLYGETIVFDAFFHLIQDYYWHQWISIFLKGSSCPHIWLTIDMLNFAHLRCSLIDLCWLWTMW